MAGFKLRYCRYCQKITSQAVKTYYDGTVVMECLDCRFRELTKKGYNYRNYEKTTSIEKIASQRV